MLRPYRHTRCQRLLLVLALSLLSLPLAGCSGCLQDPITAQQEAARKKLEEDAKRLEEERRKREREKPDFEIGRFMTQPNNLEMVEASFKPGHWTSATLEITANKEDFHGTLVTAPVQLDNMPYRLGTSRPVTLAKRQKKAVELTLYMPPYRKDRDIPMQLLARGERPVGELQSLMMTRMPDHQFYFVVLSRDAQRYQYLYDIDSVKPPSGQLFTGAADLYYKLLLPKIEQRTPLPSNPLCWTSIAYVLWDDLHPDRLTPEQQQAMLDWIHWGGQLLISGPGTLPQLGGTLLEPYLPASGGDAWQITDDSLVELNDKWTLSGPQLRPASPWSGQKLQPHKDARILVDSPEGPLLVERRLGLGRIVLSAFRLGQRELQDWKSFDGFFNACLLRRPPRLFLLSDLAEVQVTWVDDFPLPGRPPQPLEELLGSRRPYQGLSPGDDAERRRRLNPFVVSAVRIFSRDTDLDKNHLDVLYRAQQKASELEREPSVSPAEALQMAREALRSALSGEDSLEELAGSGVAGWRDNNAVAQLARDALTGGIVIPGSRFILGVLAAYLFVLVPLNFLVFRIVGRIEWAWLAVPVITIGFAVAVVRLAQLDVGFVRAKREVAIVEAQGNYPRAHVTRYTALYTSLSTTYDLRFSDPNALVQPLPTSRVLRDQRPTDVNFLRDQPLQDDGGKFPVGLEGFNVGSNTQAMLHSEHMLDLGGPIYLNTRANGAQEVVNNSELNLLDGAVIGPKGVAWVGDLPRRSSQRLEYRDPEPDPLLTDILGLMLENGDKVHDVWVSEREHTPNTARRFPPDVLNIRQVVRLAQNTTPPGEIRLVAWTDEEVPGMKIEPRASQARYANVVIVRLQPAPDSPPRPDANTRADVEKADVPAENEKPQMP